MILKADGPAVRILWSIDCNEACVTAAVRTRERQTDTPLACTLIHWFLLHITENVTVKFNNVFFINKFYKNVI